MASTICSLAATSTSTTPAVDTLYGETNGAAGADAAVGVVGAGGGGAKTVVVVVVGGTVVVVATITSTAVHDVLADFTPERIFPFASWEELITKCRNTMAHQSITSVGRGTDDRHYDLLICSAESLTWVLKLLILREAGIDIRHLRTGLKSDSSFAFYRANMRTILNAHRT